MNNTTALLSMLRLRFNIDHPNVEECYAYGYDCATAGASEEENPFKTNSREYDHWSEGWWAGFYGELPLYSLDNEEAASANISISAANDRAFGDGMTNVLLKVLEITSVLAVSALVGYQVLDLVA